MKDKKLMIIKYIFKMVLIIMLSFMYYLNKPVQTPKVLQIPQGSINQIITHLSKNGFEVNKLDSLLLRLIGSPQSGWIEIGETQSTKADFLYKLTTAKAPLVSITLVPGETSYIFLKQLADSLGLSHGLLLDEYTKQAPIAEGAFVPNTYKIPVGITEKELIRILLEHSSMQMQKFSQKVFGTYNPKKWFRYVAIASVIEKESADKSEMPLVSSVIYNRLKKGMKLQMDGTLNYGKYSHIKVTPQRIKEDTSSFNTYKYRGVPEIPVCNVSFDALRAAIFPAQSDYLYFMKSKSGKHDFSCNYSTHLANIKRATK
ncbi:MAG: endolytic transglycosylase MltG [Sulfurimonas sp.]|nr:endolytic transglycosylase MltG [Sulfurimonas sp.]